MSTNSAANVHDEAAREVLPLAARLTRAGVMCRLLTATPVTALAFSGGVARAQTPDAYTTSTGVTVSLAPLLADGIPQSDFQTRDTALPGLIAFVTAKHYDASQVQSTVASALAYLSQPHPILHVTPPAPPPVPQGTTVVASPSSTSSTPSVSCWYGSGAYYIGLSNFGFNLMEGAVNFGTIKTPATGDGFYASLGAWTDPTGTKLEGVDVGLFAQKGQGTWDNFANGPYNGWQYGKFGISQSQHPDVYEVVQIGNNALTFTVYDNQTGSFLGTQTFPESSSYGFSATSVSGEGLYWFTSIARTPESLNDGSQLYNQYTSYMEDENTNSGTIQWQTSGPLEGPKCTSAETSTITATNVLQWYQANVSIVY